DIWEMQPLRDHLRPDQDINVARAKCAQRFAIRFLSGHRVGIHSFYSRIRKNLSDERFHLFRSEADVSQRLLAALRTFLRNRGGVSAKMIIQTIHSPMNSVRYSAYQTSSRLQD